MEWIHFQQDLFKFASGESFLWSSPEITLSQFVHHWRRNNPMVYPPGFVNVKVETTISEGDEEYVKSIYDFAGLKSRIRKYNRCLEIDDYSKLHKEVIKLSKDDKFLDNIITSERENFKEEYFSSQRVLWTAKDEITDLIKITKSQLNNTLLEKVRSNPNTITYNFTNQKNLPTEHVYHFIKSNIPYHMTHHDKTQTVLSCCFTLNVGPNKIVFSSGIDYAINYMISKNRFIERAKDLLGPRILLYNTSCVIEDYAYCLSRHISTYERYFIPFQDIVSNIVPSTIKDNYRTAKIILKKPHENTVFEQLLTNSNNFHKLSKKDKKYFIQKCKRAMAKLDCISLERMLKLSIDEWFYEKYSFEEFQFLAALGKVPKCNTLEKYQFEQIGIRASENVKLIQETIEGESNEEQFPF